MNIINEVETAEKILYNPLLLENIFKFSSCQEQLKLCRICADFQDIIVKRIWKRKYKNLQILEFLTKFMIGGNVVPNETLKATEYKEFLHLCADNIRTLHINTFSLYDHGALIFIFNDLRLTNLKHLSLRNMKLMMSDIESLPQRFPTLQYFAIKSCFRCSGAPIHTLNDFDMNLFEKLQKLEEFKIEFTYQNVYLRKASS